ncbi:MAG: carboxymuconolactone decarboxylase family protein [Gemmatimonadota bacterium]|nr:MAG: carboxymuconolactone decarboxylase family protein [Gemmatimonadota bacterium]
MGGTQEQIDALLSGELEGAGFSETELAAIRLAEAMTLHSNQVPDATFAQLRRHFDEGEVVEICMVAGLFNYFNLVNNALRVEPTR